MESHGLQPDVRSYSAIIGAAALAHELDAAQSIFENMAGARTWLNANIGGLPGLAVRNDGKSRPLAGSLPSDPPNRQKNDI